MPVGGRRRAGSESTAAGLDLVDISTTLSILNDALSDSKTYRVLQPERIDEKKREFAVLSSQVSSLQNRLTLESRIRDAALNLTKSNTDRAQQRAAQEQLASANRKVDAIATDLWKVTGKLMEVERVVLKHNGGVLRTAVLHGGGEKSLGAIDRQDDPEKAKLASAELKIREFEREVGILKSTTSRLENENQDLNKRADDARDDVVRARRTIKDLEGELATARSKSSQNSNNSADYNKLKLDLATARADMAGLQEELQMTKENLSKSHTQLEEDLSSMEEKDRTIANLLSELEEVTTKLEMKTAAEAISPVASPGNVERQLRAQVAALEHQLREARLSPSSPSSKEGWNRSVGRSNSVVIREQVSKQVTAQTENLRSMLNSQLKEAVMEREKVKGELNLEREKVRDLELELETLRREGARGKPSRYANSSSDTETEDESTTKFVGSSTRSGPVSKSVSQNKSVKGSPEVSEEDVRELRRLWMDLPTISALTLTSPTVQSPPLSPGRELLYANDRNDPSKFRVEGLVSKVNRLLGDWRDLQVRLDRAESDLRLSRDATDQQSREAREFDALERDLRSDVRRLERANERLENELQNAIKQSREMESIHNAGSSSAARKLEDIQASHNREITNLTNRYERRLKDLEQELMDSYEIKLGDVERKLRDTLKEKDETAQRAAELELTFRNQAEDIERRHRDKVDEITLQIKKEITDSFEVERSRFTRIREDLEDEIYDLKKQLDTTQDSAKEDIRRQVKETEERMESEFKRAIEASEQEAADRIKDSKRSHQQEIDRLREEQSDELDRLKERLERERKQEMTEMRSQMEREAKSLEQEVTMRIASETDLLKSKHAAEIELMRTRHESELRRLKDDHDLTMEQLQGRLARSEAALMTSKSQFFEDREDLQEQIDNLEAQLRTAKQAETELMNASAAKAKEFEAKIESLQSDLTRAANEFETLRNDMERNAKDFAAQEQDYKQQIEELQDEYDTRVDELEKHLAEFDAVRGELESVERDYMTELSKHDTERMKSERALAEAKEDQNQLRQQLDSMQRKLDQAQREVIEARNAAPRTDKAVEKALQEDLERMQETVIQLKTAKNELLEEIDNQVLRQHDSQRELNFLRKENDKVCNGHLSPFHRCG
jgi:chromosome segregation ATPase